jgi:hypothetical protein
MLSVHMHTFCEQTSLCTAEHISAHAVPAYPHTSENVVAELYHNWLTISHLVFTHLLDGWWQHYSCMVRRHTWHSDWWFSSLCVTYWCPMFVLPTTVTSSSSGLTEAEFMCCRHSSIIIIPLMDIYNTVVPAAFGILASLWKWKSLAECLVRSQAGSTHHIWNMRSHSHVHTSWPLEHILSQIKPVL